MDDICGMDIETPTQQLIHEILEMIIGQVLPRIDDSVHIGLHQVSDDINVFIACRGWRLLHINQSNNVFVIKELQ